MYFSDVVTTGTQWGGESLEFKPLWGMGWGTHDWPSEFQESHRLGPSISIIWKRDHQIKRRLEAGRRRIIPWCSSHPSGLCNAPWAHHVYLLERWFHFIYSISKWKKKKTGGCLWWMGGRRGDDLRIDLPLVWRAVVAALAAGVLEFDGNLVVEKVKYILLRVSFIVHRRDE
jgi:hypothetical protein